MISVSEFFKRIGGIHATEISFRTAIQTVIRETVGIDIPIESIIFKSGSITLKNTSPVARSSIFIKKTTVIERANKIQSIHEIFDIR